LNLQFQASPEIQNTETAQHNDYLIYSMLNFKEIRQYFLNHRKSQDSLRPGTPKSTKCHSFIESWNLQLEGCGNEKKNIALEELAEKLCLL